MSWLADIFFWLVDTIWGHVKSHPTEAVILAFVILRAFGTTVQTGWKGVLFSFGRVKKELDPGFHGLIPFVHKVRQAPIRSISIHLPKQRVTTADGLVYDVQANIVYRIVEPMKALVVIDDLRKGIEAALAIVVQDLLRGQQRTQLQERKALDVAFTARADERLQGWGVTAEQAGFVTIAPTHKTLRLTQLSLLTVERDRILRSYLDAGLSQEVAVSLLGADRKIMSHSAARYRARGRQVAGYLKAFLVEERQRVVAAYIAAGLPREEALAHAAADQSWRLQAEVRARMASRASARHRPQQVVAAPVEAVPAHGSSPGERPLTTEVR